MSPMAHMPQVGFLGLMGLIALVQEQAAAGCCSQRLPHLTSPVLPFNVGCAACVELPASRPVSRDLAGGLGGLAKQLLTSMHSRASETKCDQTCCP